MKKISISYLMPTHISSDEVMHAYYLISFTLICIGLLLVFSLQNLFTGFYIALGIDLVGILSYCLVILLFRKNLDINIACGIFVLNCCMILVAQSLILEFNAYHNMFFYPPVAIFCFSMFTKKRYTFVFFGITFICSLISYFVPKYFDTTLILLSDEQKDSFVILSMIASLGATYKIGEILLKQKEEAFMLLKKTNEKLDELNTKNKKLLQLIIHDISAPLQRIDYLLGQIKYNDLEMIKEINNKSLPAIATIKEIINISREMMALSDGKIKLNLTPVDLIKVIGEVEYFYKEELNQKNIKILLDNQVSGPVFILADEKSLRTSVLSNILSNSIKFSYRNSTIQLKIQRCGDYIHLTIQDFGIGIPENLVKNIFKAEEFTTRYGTEGEKGTGYGLPLVKAFIESYDGEIDCESVENAGTSICMRFHVAHS